MPNVLIQSQLEKLNYVSKDINLNKGLIEKGKLYGPINLFMYTHIQTQEKSLKEIRVHVGNIKK